MKVTAFPQDGRRAVRGNGRLSLIGPATAEHAYPREFVHGGGDTVDSLRLPGQIDGYDGPAAGRRLTAGGVVAVSV
jgi:hypothetical protein